MKYLNEKLKQQALAHFEEFIASGDVTHAHSAINIADILKDIELRQLIMMTMEQFCETNEEKQDLSPEVRAVAAQALALSFRKAGFTVMALLCAIGLSACDGAPAASSAASGDASSTVSDAVVTACLDTSLYASYGVNCSDAGTMVEGGAPVIYCTTGNERKDTALSSQIAKDIRDKIGLS